MNKFRVRFYQPPTSLLGRLSLAVLALGALALSFVLGLVVLVVSTGLALLGLGVLSVRRWLGRSPANTSSDSSQPEDSRPVGNVIEGEYRVVHRRSPED